MNQDNDTYTLDRALRDYVVASHPILLGVNKFDGEGVSPITVNGAANPAGVARTLLEKANGQVRVPNGANQGETRASTASDGSFVIAEARSGRVAGHFDRNTFFNRGGAGTDIMQFDSRIYPRNLFAWVTQCDHSHRLDRTGWTATASVPGGAALPITAALDGDVFTRWATAQAQAAGQTFVLDMKRNNVFNRVVMEAGGNQNDNPRGFEISTSTDGVTWRQAAIGTQTDATTDVTLGAQTARYLRVQQTGSAATNWWSMAEINVFGMGSSCNPDMDGNAALTGAKEGLVLVRAMLGLTGTTVNSGTGISNAQWSVARPLLNENCRTNLAP
jgi:F5/8 type C domain